MAQELQPEGQVSFEGGQDASLPSNRIPENKVAAAINCSFSEGTIRPRFAYDRKALKFPAGGYSYRFNKIAKFTDIFYGGKFQALIPYQLGQNYYIIVVVSGVIFLINQKLLTVQVLTLNSDTQLDETANRINWSDAGKYIVLHDFPSRPIIIEGQNARRSDIEKNEVPVSTLSVFNQSRLVFTNAGSEFSAGDPVGNALTPNAPITIEEIVLEGSPYFTEVYAVPSRKNLRTTAIATLQSVDSSTGIGALIVANKSEIFAFDTAKGRDAWLLGQFGTSLNDSLGIVGQRALVNVNSDLFFVSADGQLRSLSASRDEQKKWARVPMSVQVKNWVSYLSPDLAEYSVLGYFKNKIFWTVRPYRIPATRLNGNPIVDVAHSGMVVLELDNLSRSDSEPAWAGLWTGVRPMDMCVNDERMFIMSKDYYNRNELYEVMPDQTIDTAGSQRRQIKSIIYSRSHTFGDIFMLKNLKSVEVAMENLKGQFSLDIQWKPSHSSKFLFWTLFQHYIPIEHTHITKGEIKQRAALAFQEMKFGLPEVEEGNPISGDLYDKFKRVQLKITLTGDDWKFNGYKLTATEVANDSSEFLNPADLETKPIEECGYNADWEYEGFRL